MLDFILELLDYLTASNQSGDSHTRKKRSSGTTERKARQMKRQQEQSSGGVNHHFKAEEYRKNGKPKKAVEHYRKAIGIWENVSKPLSKTPAPYRELAKLYYHAGYQERAVKVLDHYLDDEGSPPKRDKMQDLRDRLKAGDFRQLKNKYEFKGDLP